VQGCSTVVTPAGQPLDQIRSDPPGGVCRRRKKRQSQKSKGRATNLKFRLLYFTYFHSSVQPGCHVLSRASFPVCDCKVYFSTKYKVQAVLLILALRACVRACVRHHHPRDDQTKTDDGVGVVGRSVGRSVAVRCAAQRHNAAAAAQRCSCAPFQYINSISQQFGQFLPFSFPASISSFFYDIFNRSVQFSSVSSSSLSYDIYSQSTLDISY